MPWIGPRLIALSWLNSTETCARQIRKRDHEKEREGVVNPRDVCIQGIVCALCLALDVTPTLQLAMDALWLATYLASWWIVRQHVLVYASDLRLA